MLLTMIVPCLNEEEVLPLFIETADKTAAQLKEKYNLDTEYIFVDDGSKDETLAVLRRLHAKDPRVKYISFSRNFGKEAALYAGLEASAGELVAIMDADLQDPPDLLLPMAGAVIEEGYDVGAACRINRKGEGRIRSFFSRLFYKLINLISDVEIKEGARDFRLMTRPVVQAVLSLKEYNRFAKGIFAWIGFDTKWIAYENRPRAAGKTKWSFRGLCRYALSGIIGYTSQPLMFAAYIGFLFAFLSVFFIIVIIIRKLVFGDPVQGWASLVCIILFIGGIQLLCIGMIGEYLARTYTETKQRPLYIVKETEEGGASS